MIPIHSRGSCHAIHRDLDLFGLFQKTARLGDGYDGRNTEEKPFSFTDKETFSGVTILSASEVRIHATLLLNLLFNLSGFSQFLLRKLFCFVVLN